MKIQELLAIKIKCDEDKGRGDIDWEPDCDQCPLHKDIWLHVNAEFYEEVSAVSFKYSPCMMLDEIAKRVKKSGGTKGQ